MTQAVNAQLRSAQEIIRDARVSQASNGICYTTSGDIMLPSDDLERIVGAVPRSIAAALDRKAFYFVPLTMGDEDKTFIIHCASGWRSLLATQTLQRMGLRPVKNLADGFSGWKAAGGPVENMRPK